MNGSVSSFYFPLVDLSICFRIVTWKYICASIPPTPATYLGTVRGLCHRGQVPNNDEKLWTKSLGIRKSLENPAVLAPFIFPDWYVSCNSINVELFPLHDLHLLLHTKDHRLCHRFVLGWRFSCDAPRCFVGVFVGVLFVWSWRLDPINLIGCDIGGARGLGSDLMNTNSVFHFAIDGVHSLKKRGFTEMEIMSALLRETRSAVGVFGWQKKREATKTSPLLVLWQM